MGILKKELRSAVPFLAEKGGFEPPVQLPVRQFSKLLVSATHPSLRFAFYKALFFLLLHFVAVVQSAPLQSIARCFILRGTTVDLSELSLSSQKRVQRYAFFLNCANQSCRFSYFFCFFLDISYFCSTFAPDFDLLTSDL